MAYRVLVLLAAVLSAALLAASSPPADGDPRHWPQWRGPLGTGEAPHGDPPVEWSETKNLRWKAEVPGRGHSSPVVWQDAIFLTTAVATEGAPSPGAEDAKDGEPGDRPRGVSPHGELEFALLAFDRRDGRLLWRRTATRAEPHEGTHADGTWASASPVVDGEVVCAFFGSRGLYCYTLAGELLWSKDLGDMTTRLSFGEGSSPVLYGETLVVNWDHEGPSFLVALDKRTGRELWRRQRDEVTSWSTPLVIEQDGKPQVVVSATRRVQAYDLTDGEVLWEAAGMTTNTIPSPVAADGMVYLTSGFRGNALLAIRLSAARGDVTGTPAVVWRSDRDTPYVPSPLLYGGQLYYLKHNQGILTAADAGTGERRFQARLEGIDGVYASPVAAAGRVYVTGRNGVTAVLAHGPDLRVLATNRLDDRFDASGAIAGDALYLRGHRHLYALGNG